MASLSPIHLRASNGTLNPTHTSDLSDFLFCYQLDKVLLLLKAHVIILGPPRQSSFSKVNYALWVQLCPPKKISLSPNPQYPAM